MSVQPSLTLKYSAATVVVAGFLAAIVVMVVGGLGAAFVMSGIGREGRVSWIAAILLGVYLSAPAAAGAAVHAYCYDRHRRAIGLSCWPILMLSGAVASSIVRT